MFSSKLLPSFFCGSRYLKCSPSYRVPFIQQICCMKTNERGRLVGKSSVTSNRTAEPGRLVERSFVPSRRTAERGIVERRDSERSGFSEKKSRSRRKPISPLARKNPGVGHTLSKISEEANINYFDPRLYDEYMEEEFEELDSERNFFDAHEDYHAIKSEERARKKQLAYQVTKRKFFKPPVEPNLLTYAEKEHIRFLYDDEHQSWTVESLAESYPASCDIIKKIVRQKWKAKSAEDIRRHDVKVKKNWEAFKKGELLIHDEGLKQHLRKFNNRDVKVPSFEDAKKFLSKPEKKPKRIDEFSEIIESYRVLHRPSISEGPSLIGQSIFEAEPGYQTKDSKRHSTFEGSRIKTEKLKSKDNHSFTESAEEHYDRDETRKKEMRDKHRSSFTEEEEFEQEKSRCYSNRVDSEQEESKLIQENDRTARRAKHFTLNNLRDSLEKELKWEKDINSIDRQIIDSRRKNKFESPVELDNIENEEVSSSVTNESTSTKELEREKTKESSTELSFVKRVNNKLVMKQISQDLVQELKIAEYIKIPKELRKEGALYKVKDCFYADDGQFLFRVPGLKS